MLGIIILNYNSTGDTINCIRSVSQNISVPYKIFVIEGCSTDNSLTVLSDFVAGEENIQLIPSDRNGGYSYGNNIGARKAMEEGADVLLIVNPDILFIKDAIDVMYNALIGNVDVAVAGPRIFDLSGKDMQFASRIYNIKSFLSSKKPFVYFLPRGLRYFDYDHEKHFEFQGMVSGCCFMIKSESLAGTSYLDERVFLFYEEDILAYKLKDMNRLTSIISHAKVIHNHSSTIKKEGEAFTRYHRFISSQYVLKRYARISYFQYLFVSIFHIVPFAFNSVFKQSYRRLFKSFLKKTFAIANGKYVRI